MNKTEKKQYRLKRWYPSLYEDIEEGIEVEYKDGWIYYVNTRGNKTCVEFDPNEFIFTDFWELIEENKPEPLFITEDVAEFKAGDIIVDDLGTASTGDISIFKCINADNDRMFDIYVSSGSKCNHFVTIVELAATSWDYIEDQRLATDEEKHLLFNALKKEGVRWNAETLEIEELDISEIVVDYESAIEYLGIKDDPLVLKNDNRTDKFNEFEADWENGDQYNYFPIFEVEDGKIKLLNVSFAIRNLNPYTSNFSFKTEERARQFGNQFIDLFNIAMGL